MSTFVDQVEFRVITCCSCSMPFAMSQSHYDKRRTDKETFHCPEGHKQHFTGLSETEQLRLQLRRRDEQLDAANARAGRAEALRDAVTKAHKRMRARVMNGVCPCCDRTFQNLMRHMRHQHPEFTADQGLAQLRGLFGMTQAAVADEASVNVAHVSAYENGRHVPPMKKKQLDFWLSRHKGETAELNT